MDAEFAGQLGDVRRFNRFYTRAAGFLDRTLTRSEFTLTEARVLFEIAHRANPSASEIARFLFLDAAYLARILRKFAEAGLIRTRPDPADGRRRPIALTDRGRDRMIDLQQRADEDIGRLISPLGGDGRRRLVKAMRAIETGLGGGEPVPAQVTIRAHCVGDLGWIIHRQAVLYAEEYGWDLTFEGLVAGICADFVKCFTPGKEYCWVAERAGSVVGSVFLVRQDDETAKLRLLYVEPSARGAGVGGRLVGECIATARAFGYRRLDLWTNDVLVAARHVYQRAGFRLVAEERHRSFGKDLIGQNWELDL